MSTEWLAEHLDDPNVVIAHVKYEPDIDELLGGAHPGCPLLVLERLLLA